MLGKLFGDPSARKLKSFYNLIPDINILEDDVKLLTDEELRRKTSDFRLRYSTSALYTNLLSILFLIIIPAEACD